MEHRTVSPRRFLTVSIITLALGAIGPEASAQPSASVTASGANASRTTVGPSSQPCEACTGFAVGNRKVVGPIDSACPGCAFEGNAVATRKVLGPLDSVCPTCGFNGNRGCDP